MTDKSLKDITNEIETFKKYHLVKEIVLKSPTKRYKDVIVQINDSYIYIWDGRGVMTQVATERLQYLTRTIKASEMWLMTHSLQFSEDMMRPIEYWIKFSKVNKEGEVG